MIDYKDFVIPEFYWDYFVREKKSLFINSYLKDNNILPSEDMIKNFIIEEKEREDFRRMLYSKYCVSGVMPEIPNVPEIPGEEKTITFSFKKENSSILGNSIDNAQIISEEDKYQFNYLTFCIEYKKEEDGYYDYYAPYAYGVFNTFENITLKLKTGYKYKISCYYRGTNSVSNNKTGYHDSYGWLLGASNKFILSNKSLWYYKDDENLLGKGYLGIVNDFDPLKSNTINLILKKMYGILSLKLKNYNNEDISLNIGTINTSSENYNGEYYNDEYGIINREDNTLLWSLPISYNTKRTGYDENEAAFNAAINNEKFSVSLPLTISFKTPTENNYTILYSDYIDIIRGETTSLECDFKEIDSDIDVDIEIEE